MALSGSVTTTKYNSKVGLKLTWSATQSIANNTSTISWTLKSNGGSSGDWWYAGPVKVVIGGKTVLNTTSRFKLYGGGAYKKTGSVTINHNEDGSKSITISVSAAIYTASVNCTGSGSFTLDKIDRYALITAFESFNDEGSPQITYINPQGDQIVTDLKLRVTWNSRANYTSWYTLNDAGGTYTLNLSAGDRALLRAGASATNALPIEFDLQSTMDGSDWHDYKSAVMEIVNAAPSVGLVTYRDSDAAVTAITGDDQVIVQTRSTLVINTTASTGNKGASIVSYSLNFNGSNYTPDGNGDVTFVKPNTAGTYPATVTTTDSRGNTAQATISVPISGWDQPTAVYSFERVADFVTNDAILHVDGKISTVAGSALKIYESHSEKGSGIWSTPVEIADDTDVTISNLNYQKEYELIITVSDSFTRADSPTTNTTYTVGIGKGIPLFMLDPFRGSVAVNGIADGDDQLYVGGQAHIKPNDTDAGVMLPHAYSTTEQIVDYWIDGSPVYEQTVELTGGYTTVSGNGYLTVPSGDFNERAIPIDIVTYNINGTGGSTNRQVWRCILAQINTADGTLQIHNTRSSAIGFDTFTIKYIKV